MAATLYSAEQVRHFPDDGNRYEVVDGELLVTPAPTWTHQRVVLQFILRLHPYITCNRLGELLPSPADIELDPRSLVQPDLFVYGLLDGKLPRDWNSGAPLLLVIEVLSPGTARTDRTTKRRRYQKAGIPEYWIADADARIVERWRPGDERPEVLADTLEFQPAGAAEPLRINLKDLFAQVHGEA